MSFTGIAYPEDLAVLRSALDDYCIMAGIERGSPQHLEAARIVMRLFSHGLSEPDELRTALYRRLLPPLAYEGSAALQSVEG